MNKPEEIFIYTDGGSRGNPGEAAYGFVVFDKDSNRLYEEGKRIGINTNNVAEYSAVLGAFKWLEGHDYHDKHIAFYMDSLLVASQLAGKWKIKNEILRGFYWEIKEFEKKLGEQVTYSHVPREKNTEADRMVNLALDGML